MKLLGFLLLCGSGFGMGQLAFSRVLRKRVCIEEGIALMSFVERELRYTRAEPQRLLSEAVKLEIAPDILSEVPDSFQEVTLPDSFTKGEKGYFREVFGQMGHLPAEQCCKTLEQLTHWLEELRERQKALCGQAARIDRQLGFCGGLALAILLL